MATPMKACGADLKLMAKELTKQSKVVGPTQASGTKITKKATGWRSGTTALLSMGSSIKARNTVWVHKSGEMARFIKVNGAII